MTLFTSQVSAAKGSVGCGASVCVTVTFFAPTIVTRFVSLDPSAFSVTYGMTVCVIRTSVVETAEGYVRNISNAVTVQLLHPVAGCEELEVLVYETARDD